MRKIPALLGFDTLYTASVVFQHNAGTIPRIDKGKSLAVALEPAIGVDERAFPHTQILGYSADIFVRQANIALPAATGTAADAAVRKNFSSVCGIRNHAGFPKVCAWTQ